MRAELFGNSEQFESTIGRSGDPLADVIAGSQSEIDRLVAIHTDAIAAKDAEILQLRQENDALRLDVDAAEVRGARAILAELFRRFTGN